MIEAAMSTIFLSRAGRGPLLWQTRACISGSGSSSTAVACSVAPYLWMLELLSYA